jgi:predicted CoA-binding protein
MLSIGWHICQTTEMTTVAVIGASNDQRKFGNKAVRAFLRAGYKVIAVNPKLATVGGKVEGCDTYGTVLDVPHDIDLATLYVPPDIGEDVISSIAEKKISELWVNPGAESRKLIERSRQQGIVVREQCSIIAIGQSPADYE